MVKVMIYLHQNEIVCSLFNFLFYNETKTDLFSISGMNIFVAFFVLLLLLAESTPPAASSIPLIGMYFFDVNNQIN